MLLWLAIWTVTYYGTQTISREHAGHLIDDNKFFQVLSVGEVMHWREISAYSAPSIRPDFYGMIVFDWGTQAITRSVAKQNWKKITDFGKINIEKPKQY